MITANQQAHEHRYKTLVVIIALMIHLLLCSTFFIVHFHQDGDTVSFSANHDPHEAPVVFQHIDTPPAQEIQTQTPASMEEWASMTAAPSSFGTPPDEVELSQEQEYNEPLSNRDAEMESKSSLPSTATDQIASTPQEISFSPDIAPTSLATIPDVSDTSEQPTTIPASIRKGKGPRLTENQKKAAQQLAAFAKGYLDQQASQGSDMVTLVGGNPNKRPTAEQLKYERYWAKLQWCLQNSFQINKDNYQATKPMRCMMKVYFRVHRDGSLFDLHIIQGSGDRTLDAFMHNAFEYAGSSFPPLPTFIQDPYAMTWLIDVAIDTHPRWFASR